MAAVVMVVVCGGGYGSYVLSTMSRWRRRAEGLIRWEVDFQMCLAGNAWTSGG